MLKLNDGGIVTTSNHECSKSTIELDDIGTHIISSNTTLNTDKESLDEHHDFDDIDLGTSLQDNNDSSSCNHWWPHFSAMSKLYLCGFTIIWLVILCNGTWMFVVYPMFFAPLSILMERSHKSKATSADSLLKAFGLSFVLCPLMMAVCIVVVESVSSVTLWAKSVAFSVFILVLVQVVIEEVFKFILIRRTLKRAETLNHSNRFAELKSGLFSSMAVSAGYGCCQGMIMSLLVIGHASLIPTLILSTVISLLYIPFHCLTGYLYGLQLGRRQVLQEKVFLIEIFAFSTPARTIFLFQFFFWPLAIKSGTVLLSVCILSSLALFVATLTYIRSIKRKLPNDFLDNAGYNALLRGYTILEDGEI